MEQKGFTKECALIAKGIFVLLMLLHHVFYGSTLWEKPILTAGDKAVLSVWSIYGKVCVGGFAFISAYGITKQLMKIEENPVRGAKTICIQRLLKLESACLFIYPPAVLYKRFIVHQPIKTLYMAGDRFRPVYMLLDALGLAELFGTPQINVTWWYLSFAILLILSLPALFWLYKKTGWSLFFLAILLFDDKKIAVVILGIACAYEGILEKLEERLSSSVRNWIAGLAVSLFLLWTSYEIVAIRGTADGIQWGAGALIAFIAMMYVSRIPLVAPLLKLIGRYSGNIFMVHTFIYLYFYEDFIYSFRWAGIIYGVLLLCSLAVSVALELGKKLIGYDKRIARLSDLLCGKISA